LNDWFLWNGTRCTDYGIHVLNQPDIVRPAERVSTEKVFGRSGTLTKLEGDAVFDEFIAPVECIIRDTSRLREINAWLHGDEKVAFANRTGGFFYARVANQIDYAKILRGNPHRSFTINFRCQPFLYHDDSPAETLLESGAFIVNPGTAASEPIITVIGSGDITLVIGQYIIELESIEASIILDTPRMEAYKMDGIMPVNQNAIMTGEFPLLVPGTNAISWTGNVVSLTIEPNWRDL
jgi:phage-related protein